LKAIFSQDPLVILSIDKTGGIVGKIIKYRKINMTNIRGGYTIKYKDGYLAIVHEAIQRERRYYVHRFCFYNQDFDVIKLTFPFKFTDNVIEYVCGMTLSFDEKNIVLGVGIEDHSSFICEIGLDVIENYPHLNITN
jgi:hypothetical protein